MADLLHLPLPWCGVGIWHTDIAGERDCESANFHEPGAGWSFGGIPRNWAQVNVHPRFHVSIVIFIIVGGCKADIRKTSALSYNSHSILCSEIPEDFTVLRLLFPNPFYSHIAESTSLLCLRSEDGSDTDSWWIMHIVRYAQIGHSVFKQGPVLFELCWSPSQRFLCLYTLVNENSVQNNKYSSQQKSILERKLPENLKLAIAKKIENNLFSRVIFCDFSVCLDDSGSDSFVY